MNFDKIQEEGFDIKSFYNRLNNILHSYINNYTYNEYQEDYYKMIFNIINEFNNEEFTSMQDLYNKYNIAHYKIKQIHLLLEEKNNILKRNKTILK